MKTLIFLLLLLISPAALSQSLWEHTTLGMSVEDMRTAYPEAVEVNHEPTRKGGVSDYWKLENVSIGDSSFTASFFFKEHRLELVVLQPATTDIAKRSAVAETLRMALVQKYGEPMSKRTIPGQFVQGTVWSWLKEGSSISLSTILGLTGNTLSVDVRYEGKPLSASERL